ncbi:hypothetical protein DSO57_1006926 [Entomophthora muscae]|uniref:Uncharacterized protein n=1 Tax=Entomophthora muscae TaxID=34485 RepID=A0ACC2SWP0_9FUNG|nr:hypothetical protein DSO57_1006926 [Entomophthora muscae]
MHIHSSPSDCLDHPKMKRTWMQEPGRHQKILPETILSKASTIDVNLQDIHKAQFTTLVLIPISKPAGHPCCVPVSALGGNSSLPDFYFGEDVLAFLDKVETFTVGYTEEQKIKYLLNSFCQNSFDTIMPYLGFSYSYQYLQRDYHLDASENSNGSRNSPESPNTPIAGSLNKVKHPDSLACEFNQVSEAQYLAEEDQLEFVENIFEPKKSLTEVEPTKSPIIHEEYSEKKQDLAHEVNSMESPLPLPEPLPPEDPGTAKPFPIRAGDCFKDEKVSEDDEALQEEKVVELLISQVDYKSLAENVTVPLLSLPKSLPPEEPSFILKPHNKSCSRKGIEDKCFSKEYNLESFGSLALT